MPGIYSAHFCSVTASKDCEAGQLNRRGFLGALCFCSSSLSGVGTACKIWVDDQVAGLLPSALAAGVDCVVLRALLWLCVSSDGPAWSGEGWMLKPGSGLYWELPLRPGTACFGEILGLLCASAFATEEAKEERSKDCEELPTGDTGDCEVDGLR